MSVHYSGVRAFVAEELGRQLTDEERGAVLSFLEVDAIHLAEATRLCASTPVFAIAYMSYVIKPELAGDVKTYVYRVLKDGEDVRELIKAGILPG